MANSYRDLDVWQRSIELVMATYAVTKNLPDSERFGLVSQMQRAAVSVPANIAEGYGRSHRREYVQHLSISRASLMELETHLTITARLEYVTREDAVPVWQLAQQVGQMLNRLISSLRPGPRNPEPGTR